MTSEKGCSEPIGPGQWSFTEGFNTGDLKDAKALLDELAWPTDRWIFFATELPVLAKSCRGRGWSKTKQAYMNYTP